MLTKLITTYSLVQASYKSFKALDRALHLERVMTQRNYDAEKKRKRTLRFDQNEIIPALQFWTVFAFVHLYDYYLEFLIDWFPFYSMIKTLILIWLILPWTQGSAIVYKNIIKPQMAENSAYLKDTIMPWIRMIALTISRTIMRRTFLDRSALHTVSDQELESTIAHLERLHREIKREQLRRLGYEAIQERNDSNNNNNSALVGGDNKIISPAQEIHNVTAFSSSPSNTLVPNGIIIDPKDFAEEEKLALLSEILQEFTEESADFAELDYDFSSQTIIN